MWWREHILNKIVDKQGVLQNISAEIPRSKQCIDIILQHLTLSQGETDKLYIGT